MSTGTIRWAIIGTGGIAARTLPDLRLTENAEVVAVYSRTQERADEFAQAHGVPAAHGDLATMLASPDIDAVYVCTPHPTHFAYAQQTMRAGKHVLCEKPLTMNVADARELQRIAAENSVFLMEAMWTRFNPIIRRAIDLVAAGAIGEPRFAQSGMGFPVPPDGPQRFWRAELGGGALFDMGVYTVGFAQLFLGRPDAVSTTGVMRDDDIDLFEAVTLSFGARGTAQATSSITAWVPAGGSIGGTAGSISFVGPVFAPTSFRLTTGTPPHPPTSEDYTAPLEGAGYVPMFRAVSAAILAGQLGHEYNPMSSTIEVLETLEIVRDQLNDERNKEQK